MKTLDEVIKALEVCMADADDAIESEGVYLATDALHYLKEYRFAVENCADALAEKYPSENVPLTWDELKGMEGKPVWIELLDHGIWEDPSHRVDSEWWIIGEVRKNDIIAACYLDEIELCEEDLGKTWQAYRKERE